MRIKPINIIIMFFAFFLSAKAEKILKNYDVIDSLLDLSAEKFVSVVEKADNKSISIEINQHPAAWLLDSKIHKRCSDKNIKIFNKSSNGSLPLELWLEQIKIEYHITDICEDTLNRIITTKVSGKYTKSDGEIVIIPEIIYNYKDFIDKKDIDLINSKEHDFAQAQAPAEESSFWDDAVQPLLFISTTIVTIILLFTIRSK